MTEYCSQCLSLVGHLLTLSVSRLYEADDGMINEYGAVEERIRRG
jgi:hypothetical protein